MSDDILLQSIVSYFEIQIEYIEKTRNLFFNNLCVYFSQYVLWNIIASEKEDINVTLLM